MTNQEAFNSVWERLVTKAYLGRCETNGKCQYINEDLTNQCAIGYLMPDELCIHVENNLDRCDSNILSVVDEFKEVSDFFSGVDPILLKEMQNIHDIWYDDAKNRLKHLAPQYSLTCPV